MHAQPLLASLHCRTAPEGAVWDRVLSHPGEAFEALGLEDGASTLAELKMKEITTSRLAVLPMFVYYVQAVVIGEGPIGNWAADSADPFAVNSLSLPFWHANYC